MMLPVYQMIKITTFYSSVEGPGKHVLLKRETSKNVKNGMGKKGDEPSLGTMSYLQFRCDLTIIYIY
jgi:hypothetical protein